MAVRQSSVRTAAMTAAALCVTGLATACDDQSPPPSVPITPRQGPVQLLPDVFLLRSDQMPGYGRSGSQTVSAAALAVAEGDPGIEATLHQQGYEQGAQWTYAPPQGNPNRSPFTQVVSSASIFGSSTGAAAFDADERRRHDQPPSGGGTVSHVTEIPSTGLDALAVYAATSGAGAQTAQSYFAVIRRGRVVAEIFAGGDPALATVTSFGRLVAAEAERLADAPS